MNGHGGIHGGDRRPWLIISQREAAAMLAVVRDYLDGAPLPVDEDLLRAERVLANQLAYIERGVGPEPTVTDTLIREMRA